MAGGSATSTTLIHDSASVGEACKAWANVDFVKVSMEDVTEEGGEVKGK